MIRTLWLRWYLSALRKQEAGLRAEAAGTAYMLAKCEAAQRRIQVELALAETDRRYRVAR